MTRGILVSVGAVVALILIYVGSYCYVRETHTEVHPLGVHVSGLANNPQVETTFDLTETKDRWLYRVYLPALKVDRAATGREFYGSTGSPYDILRHYGHLGGSDWK